MADHLSLDDLIRECSTISHRTIRYTPEFTGTVSVVGVMVKGFFQRIDTELDGKQRAKNGDPRSNGVNRKDTLSHGLQAWQQELRTRYQMELDSAPECHGRIGGNLRFEDGILIRAATLVEIIRRVRPQH